MTADEIKTHLGLAPHPREGGWFVRTYEASETVDASAFEDARYIGPRRTGTAIYYLLEPDTYSAMHRLQSDEVFHFYAGDAVELLELQPTSQGKTPEGRVTTLGTNLARGERPQLVVPRGTWQGSRLLPGGQWALLGCTVSPGFEFDDYEDGSRADLIALWPAWRERIEALTRA